MNIRLTLEYDGTAYAGWQRQGNADTVQNRVEDALLAVTGRRLGVVASGRTDAGVHALGQVCHFHTDAGIPPDRYALALNTHLPRDIRILESREAAGDFHARYSAKGKHYRYRLYVREAASALEYRRAWHVMPPLDTQAMALAAWYLPGCRDFSSFMASGSAVKNAVRTMMEASVTPRNPFVDLDFTADGFLYHMVRILAGTLVEIGRNRRAARSMGDILEARDRRVAGVTAPACGLYLVGVSYGEDAQATDRT